jgi:hypothetical protein
LKAAPLYSYNDHEQLAEDHKLLERSEFEK